MGFVAEAVFHLAPLALLLMVFSALGLQKCTYTAALIILLAAMIEPAFQIRAGLLTGNITGLDIYVGLHVFAFNICELIAFRRWGFFAMVFMRFNYYLWWHIIWGYLRLEWLF